MTAIPQGNWRVGYTGAQAYPADCEGLERQVVLGPYLIDRKAVTNAAFAQFVAATGHVTDAERQGSSFVFYAQVHPGAIDHVAHANPNTRAWWTDVAGANWACPDGPGSCIAGREDHPVVHVSWNDAVAYAMWAGKRLPTELEWEVAARGGLAGKLYPWGNDLTPNGAHHCNIWQGVFPHENTGEDGYLSTAPADAYAANGYGLFNMVGNTWEWSADSWSQSNTRTKAMRGGSYLCHQSYCNRYRVTARTGNVSSATSSHLGFRCAADIIKEDNLE